MTCYSHCNDLLNSKEGRKWQLRAKYKTFLKGSEFRNLCVNTLDHHFNEELELEEE